MAEKDDSKTPEKSEGAGAPSPDAAKKDQQPDEPKEPATRRTRTTGGGEFVVIADQVPLKSGTGKDATFTTHKRGEKVKLTAEQAAKHTTGTRPAVVAAEKVKDGNVDAAARLAIREAAEQRAKSRRR